MERSEEHSLHQESLMDGFQATPTAGEEGRKKDLPEVKLKWSDFVYSLEKLRHRPFCKSSNERLEGDCMVWI